MRTLGNLANIARVSSMLPLSTATMSLRPLELGQSAANILLLIVSQQGWRDLVKHSRSEEAFCTLHSIGMKIGTRASLGMDG
jgi:hypothetical protein